MLSASRPGPAARWIAPSTPPPPRKAAFAALTIASTRSRVMSPGSIRMRSETSAIGRKVGVEATWAGVRRSGGDNRSGAELLGQVRTEQTLLDEPAVAVVDRDAARLVGGGEPAGFGHGRLA